MFAYFLVTLPVVHAASCVGGCSGHGTCGLLGTCICEGNWAGRDCSFQLSIDLALPESESQITATTDSVLQARGADDQADVSPGPLASSLLSYQDQIAEDTPKEAHSGALAFAQARRAARDAWAAADRLFEAAKQENARDADERLQRAMEKARSRKDSIPGNTFAGLQVPASMPETHKRLCSSNCNDRGMCLAGKCVCQAGFHGESCEHKECQNGCNGHGSCFQGRCTCEESFGGEDCSQKVTPVLTSFTSKLSEGLAAERAELEKQSHIQKAAKACALNCDGHGSCRDGVCECHDGWGGPACQDYLQPVPPFVLEQVAQQSCRDPLCSGRGFCQSGSCICTVGFGGEACELVSAAGSSEPLQLQLQQVTEDDRKAEVCLGGCGGHGTCKAGMCECEAGWQGTSCSISAEVALHGVSKEPEQSLLGVPTAASWIASEAPVAPSRALRAGQDLRPAALLSSSATVQQDSKRSTGSTESSVGSTAAAALHSFLSRTAASAHPVDSLAALLKSAVAAPQD